ncbi:response regulator [Rhizobium sp. XQZ8]|uniref:response regulator n=1 Tax=Rhizobium populisoli TaxID=2859785 RepID=UPI001CA50281|nr:response regulator [Rhizobium populisoli]MBW6424807.1 response regulator [Rhizobium populisoli]
MREITKQLLLLTEDDAILMLDAEETLVGAGFGVITAVNGTAALAIINEDAGRFCAIITDIRLGQGPSGWDVGHRVRELVPTMPVIYMTADSAAEWSAHGVPNSVLIPKPFVPAQLITAVSTLLNQVATSLPPAG